MIYAVLVLLYNDFLYPFAVMIAIPLCIGGALMGLLIAQKPLGLFALIGIVLLIGLVTKNSILLVDYALIAVKEGKISSSGCDRSGHYSPATDFNDLNFYGGGHGADCTSHWSRW